MSYSDVMLIKQLLEKMEERMTEREDTAWAGLSNQVTAVKDGWSALQAENANLKSQLDAAGVDFQAKLDADSEADAGKVEQATAALNELTNQAESGDTGTGTGGTDTPPAEPTA
jgi:hypothetical protein